MLLYDKYAPGMPQYDNTTRYEDIEDPAFMERLEEVKGAAPASWSWVEQGGMSSVKNQVSSELLSTKQSNFSFPHIDIDCFYLFKVEKIEHFHFVSQNDWDEWNVIYDIKHCWQKILKLYNSW